MAIYITGDIHGKENRFSYKNWDGARDTTVDDIIIIAGDFGIVWSNDRNDRTEKYKLDWLADRPLTFAFVDGNHENHNRLDAMPVTHKWGGCVHKLRDNIYHLMRGEMFSIPSGNGDECLDVFAFGGAKSHDRWWRISDLSWWEREIPSVDEMQHGIDTIDEHKGKCDIVVTHCAPSKVQKAIDPYYEDDPVTKYLQFVDDCLDYKDWYFGHYHMNEDIDSKHHCLYENIIKIA